MLGPRPSGCWIEIACDRDRVDRVNEAASCAGLLFCLSLRAMGFLDQADGAISTG